MAYVAVTVIHGSEKRDLALPMGVPSRLVMEGVLKVLKIPARHGQNFSFSLQDDRSMRHISPNASLGEVGVLHGAVLQLMEATEVDAPPRVGAFLRADSGGSYPLATRLTVIGRNVPRDGIFVEIDLTPLATDPRAISRRHAQLEQEGDRFFLTDLTSTNGTKLNGTRLPPRERKPIWDGDVIEFGRNAARLTFCASSK